MLTGKEVSGKELQGKNVHTFILVDGRGIVRFDKDYPSMWIEPAKLLEELPKT